MEAVELRKKWIQSITKVDEGFLRLIDDLYKNYIEKENDFFDELPKEIQESLMLSREDAKKGKVRPHEDVMVELRKKYNITS